MEIRNDKIMKRYYVFPIYLLIGLILYACNSTIPQENRRLKIHPTRHVLIPLSPTFSIIATGDTLYKQYLQLNSGKEFPFTGILYVDGKGYRFMGGDSLRIQALIPLSQDCNAWEGKYSFLYPGKNWQNLDYDDSSWHKGKAAFGPEDHKDSVNTIWTIGSIYIRRHFNLNNKKELNNHKLYLRYIHNTPLSLFCNGKNILENKNNTFTKDSLTIQCKRLPEHIVDIVKEDNNILAATSYSKGENPLLDYGIYRENQTYRNLSLPYLKEVDIQTSQTHYTFQCGEVELRLDWASPSLLQRPGISGCPVGLLNYVIHSTDGKPHKVEILFDIDTTWLFGHTQI